MKLTWFAGTTIRIHIGGQILVGDPEGAPASVDLSELVSGADRVFASDDDAIPALESTRWRPRTPPRVIDEVTEPGVLIHRLGPGALLVDAAGESPLILLKDGPAPHISRWAGDAVLALLGDGPALVAAAVGLLETSPPRLIALAAAGPALEDAIAALRDHLGTTGLISLDPGLAIEV